MLSNEEVIEVAKAITSAALSNGGKLNPAQSDKFIDYVVAETILKDNARVQRFRQDELEIDKIGVGKRVAMPKAEAVDPGRRRGINTSKITLQPKEIIVPWEIGDNFKEVNIEGENVEDHIVQMMARALANDFEELYINGNAIGQASLEADILDSGSTTLYVKDSYLALFDGWLELAELGHIYDAGGSPIGLNVFGGMLRSMPTKFRRDKRNLRFYMSTDLAQLYFEKLSSRVGALGDAAAGGAAQKPFGVEIVEVPLMTLKRRVTENLILPGTTAVALKYNNVANVVVTVSTLADAPTAALVNGVDYDLVASAGTVARHVGGAIGDGDTVKVTYDAQPQVILTHKNNWLIGIGRDVRIEKDRDIYKTVNQYAITAKVSCNFEEEDAIVLGVNIGSTL